MLPDVLSQVTGEITQVSGDGAYDTRDCYEAVLERDAVPTLLPRRNAKPRPSREQWRLKRDAILKAIEVLGRYEWRVAPRGTDNQTTEAMIKAAVLNRMVRLGMPESVRVMA